MAKRKNKADFSLTSSKNMRNVSIILSVIIYSILRMLIVRKSGVIGSAYFFSTYDFIMLFAISGSLGILEIVSRHTREQVKIDSYKNAIKILRFGGVIAFLYSLIVGILLNASRNAISTKLLNAANTELTLRLLIPALFFISFSASFKGFFLGAKLKKQLYITEVVEKASMLVGVLIFSGVFNNYGAKVVMVLYDIKLENAFASAGGALGILIGSIVGLICCIVMYITSINSLIIHDETRRRVDIYDLGAKMIAEVLVLGISTVFLYVFLVVNYCIYTRAGANDSASLTLYNGGAFVGVFWTIIICPLLFTFIYSFLDRATIRTGYYSNDRHELRIKISNSVKQYLIYIVPTALYLLVMSDYVIKALFGFESEVAAGMVRLGVFAAVIYGLSIILVNILVAINRTGACMISGIVSLIADVLTIYFAVIKLGMGVNGLIIAFYVYAIVYFVLNLFFMIGAFKQGPQIIVNLIRPVIGGVIIAALSFILRIVLGFFAPALVTVVVTAFISFIFMFIFYAKTGAINGYSVSRSPIAVILMPLGRILRLF